MSGNLSRLENPFLKLNLAKTCARITTLQSKPTGRNILNNAQIRKQTDKRFGAGALCLAGRAIDELHWDIERNNNSIICQHVEDSRTLRKTYCLDQKLPRIEVEFQGFASQAKYVGENLEAGISLPGASSNDQRLLGLQAGSRELQAFAISSLDNRYHVFPEHSGWLLINNRATGKTLVIINGQQEQKFRAGIFKQHVTLLSPLGGVNIEPGNNAANRIEYWLLNQKTYSLTKASRLLTAIESGRLVKALAQIHAPAKKVFFDQIIKTPVYQTSGGQAEVAIEFSWKDGGKQKKVSASGGKIQLPPGQTGRWLINLKLQEEIRKGGNILLRRRSATAFGCALQIEDEQREDYLKAETSAKAILQTKLEPISYLWQAGSGKKKSSLGARIIITDGKLGIGDQVIVTLGALAKGRECMIPAMGIPLVDQRDKINNQLEVYLDSTGDKIFRRAGPALICEKLATQPRRLVVVADSLAKRGRARIVVSLEDINNNLCATYSGTAIVTKGAREIDKKFPLRNGYGEALLHLPEDAEATQVEISLPELGLKGVSNVIQRKGMPGNKQLYWGEMHVHTNLSHDGQGKIDNTYKLARKVVRLDFCAVANHTANLAVGQVMPGKLRKFWEKKWWQAHQQAVRKFYTPGKFVPILAQEIHPGDGGDHNIFYPDVTNKMIIPYTGHNDMVKAGSAYEDLYAKVRQRKAVIVPHVGGGEKQWLWHDDAVERMVEIASIHGCFESFAQAGLGRGYRFGFVFGSDCHLGIPASGAYNSDSMQLPGHNETVFSSGTTAAWGRELTASGIITALRNRSCYACKGRERPLVRFTVNDILMGGEGKSATAPWIQGRISAGKRIRAAHLIRNRNEIKRYSPGQHDFTFSYEDQYPEKGINYYYLRVVLEGDEIAWASPVWIDCQAAKSSRKRKEYPWNHGELYSLEKINQNPASKFESEVNQRLRKLAGNRFSKLKGLRVVDDGYARYARLVGYDRSKGGAKISVMYFFEFNKPLLTISDGWNIFDTMRLWTLRGRDI
ncbi:MAG: hypothetical protein JXA52_03415 [Planctomycetes bacterium]|nr:hypothetical protein [Planctomycetota bacterium]